MGGGVPSALQIRVALWFSRTLTVEGELSRSMMFGGTEKVGSQSDINASRTKHRHFFGETSKMDLYETIGDLPRPRRDETPK